MALASLSSRGQQTTHAVCLNFYTLLVCCCYFIAKYLKKKHLKEICENVFENFPGAGLCDKHVHVMTITKIQYDCTNLP